MINNTKISIAGNKTEDNNEVMIYSSKANMDFKRRTNYEKYDEKDKQNI